MSKLWLPRFTNFPDGWYGINLYRWTRGKEFRFDGCIKHEQHFISGGNGWRPRKTFPYHANAFSIIPAGGQNRSLIYCARMLSTEVWAAHIMVRGKYWHEGEYIVPKQVWKLADEYSRLDPRTYRGRVARISWKEKYCVAQFDFDYPKNEYRKKMRKAWLSRNGHRTKHVSQPGVSKTLLPRIQPGCKEAPF